MIAPNTTIGLGEIGAVRSTRDFQEVGEVNPNIRSLIAYSTDSRVTPTIRSNGILMAQIVPSGGLISGQSSVVQLDAWNWEDAAVSTDEGIHLRWPSYKFTESKWRPPVKKQKETAEKRLKLITQTMSDARSYLLAKEAGTLTETNLKWEAMIPVLKKQKPFYIHANSEKQLVAAMAFKQKHDVDVVLIGGKEANLIADQLKAEKVPVIIGKVHALPGTEDSNLDAPFILPKQLQDAGVLFCLSGDGHWDQRNLPFYAGTAVAYGLGKEAALQALTLNTAKILGIDTQVGSLEVGKDATLIVSTGDVLDMRTSIIEHAFIQGRKMDLGNKQKDLYEKFTKKYEAEK